MSVTIPPMRRLLSIVLLLGILGAARPQAPQLSTALPQRKPPRPSDGQVEVHPPPDSVSAALLALTGPHKVALLMDQCDDECRLLVNGNERSVSTASSPPTWIDLSNDVVKFHKNGQLLLQVVNNAQVWSYRIQLRIDNKVIWRDECGVPSRTGCEHNDQTQGVVREIELHF